MKIRCGSHQQNRSIVRPGLSLMAAKVALTAEEFRENSQRSIDLFNTEKLSTDSTRVLKSAYCILCISAAAICTERVEAKDKKEQRRAGKAAAICTERVEAKALSTTVFSAVRCCNLHGACGGKAICWNCCQTTAWLQSARSVWRQRNSISMLSQRSPLQSARSGWRQRTRDRCSFRTACVAICTGRAEKPNGIIPRKNPRKFMQTYCIFIHPGV